MSRERDIRLAWFFAILSALLVIMSFPIDGLGGIALALAGAASGAWSIRIQRRKGGA